MNSEEIKKWRLAGRELMTADAHNTVEILREIAYQLAVMNEQKQFELQQQSEARNS
jgi:hypothetical protein